MINLRLVKVEAGKRLARGCLPALDSEQRPLSSLFARLLARVFIDQSKQLILSLNYNALAKPLAQTDPLSADLNSNNLKAMKCKQS